MEHIKRTSDEKSREIKLHRMIRKRKMIQQKLTGICMLLLCALLIALAWNGKTPEESDITPVLFFAPVGIAMLFSKECWIH